MRKIARSAGHSGRDDDQQRGVERESEPVAESAPGSSASAHPLPVSNQAMANLFGAAAQARHLTGQLRDATEAYLDTDAGKRVRERVVNWTRDPAEASQLVRDRVVPAVLHKLAETTHVDPDGIDVVVHVTAIEPGAYAVLELTARPSPSAGAEPDEVAGFGERTTLTISAADIGGWADAPRPPAGEPAVAPGLDLDDTELERLSDVIDDTEQPAQPTQDPTEGLRKAFEAFLDTAHGEQLQATLVEALESGEGQLAAGALALPALAVLYAAEMDVPEEAVDVVGELLTIEPHERVELALTPVFQGALSDPDTVGAELKVEVDFGPVEAAVEGGLERSEDDDGSDVQASLELAVEILEDTELKLEAQRASGEQEYGATFARQFDLLEGARLELEAIAEQQADDPWAYEAKLTAALELTEQLEAETNAAMSFTAEQVTEASLALTLQGKVLENLEWQLRGALDWEGRPRPTRSLVGGLRVRY